MLTCLCVSTAFSDFDPCIYFNLLRCQLSSSKTTLESTLADESNFPNTMTCIPLMQQTPYRLLEKRGHQLQVDSKLKSTKR